MDYRIPSAADYTGFLRLTQDRQWTLSATYDLTFSEGPRGEHHLDLCGEGRAPTKVHLLRMAQEADMKASVAQELIDQVATALESFTLVAQAYPIPRATVEALARRIGVAFDLRGRYRTSQGLSGRRTGRYTGVMKTKALVVGVCLVLILGLVGGWYWRTQKVVWGISHPNQQTLLSSLGPDLDSRALVAGVAPWDLPDLTLRWIDPWAVGGQDLFVRPVSGAPPRELLAFEVFGLLASRLAPAPGDFKAWSADLDKKVSGIVPLAVAARSDSELLTLILWFGEGVLGPEQLQETLASLATNPAGSVDPSGSLSAEHPWRPVLDEIRRWAALGRLGPQWWDTANTDVVAAVSQGRARWGLGWSGAHFSAVQEGIPTSSLRVVPAWPNHRSLSLIGRWLFVESSPGWGDLTRVAEARALLTSVSVGQEWLTQGLLLADPSLPAVNQETKALGIGLLSAGAMITAPTATTDLSQWKPLLDAVRVALRQ